MPLVSLSGVGVSFGARRLFEGVNLTVATGTRMALVGPNGSGKTTLMRFLAGQGAPDIGSVVREKDTRVSYVPQSGVVLAGGSLRDEAGRAFERGTRILADIADVEERLGGAREAGGGAPAPGVEALLWKHHALQEQLEATGYHQRAERISRVLGGLGFAAADFEKPATAFSAGWQMRIALARAILEQPDILLLDEPTNYLDLEARGWLEQFLEDFPGGLLLVSHDRWFLDTTIRSVAEIWMARVSVYTGTYTAYEEARSRELESVIARWKVQQEEIARAEAFIRRFRYKASKARQVQSRVTALEKIERIEIPPVMKAIGFSFPEPPTSGRLVLGASGLAKAYAGRQVFAGAGVEVSRGDKLVVVGVNGAGKSTLLRIIAGRESPDAGTLAWGTGVVPAFYSQEAADAWTSDRQVIEELEAAAPTHLQPQLRTLLGAFLFRGDDVFKSVSVLSGGERSRLALLMLLLRPANLLILDEPTNHLDIASKDVLLQALTAFAGTVIFVSHDRQFIARLAGAVLEVKDGGTRSFPGDWDYYQRRVAQEAAGGAPAGASAPARTAAAVPAPREVSAAQRGRQEDKRLKAEVRSLERQEAELLARLESLEVERRAVEEEMARPESYANGEAMKALRRRHGEVVEGHAEAEARWAEVDARLAAARGATGDRAGR